MFQCVSLPVLISSSHLRRQQLSKLTARCLQTRLMQPHDYFPFSLISSDVGRAVYAPAHITEKVVQLFRSKSEFTFLASIQQKPSTSGVIFSIHESEHRYCNASLNPLIIGLSSIQILHNSPLGEP